MPAISRLLPSFAFASLLCASSQQAQDLLQRAQALLKQENLDSARKLLDEAKRLDPENVEILYQRGYVLYRERNLAEAKREFLTVVKLAPPGLRSRYFLGRIALLEGRLAEAAEWLAPLESQQPPIFDGLAQLGKAWLDLNQPQKALRALQAAVRQSPWDGSLYYLLGRAYQKLGQEALSKEAFATSQRLKASDQQSVAKLLECSQYLANGEKTQALEVRRELLQIGQADPDTLIALGVLLANAGLESEALEPFQAAAARNPFLFQAHYNGGLALLKSGQATRAEAALEKAVALLPQSAEANSALALAYIAQAKYGQAIAPLESLQRLGADNSHTTGLLATAYLRTGSPQKAISLLQQALKTETKKEPSLYFLLVESLNAAQDEAGALVVAQEAVGLFPNLPRAWLAQGQQLARAGRYREAGPFFAKASELAPEGLEALLGLAEVQQKTGAYEQSLASYQRILAKDPANVTAQLGVARNLISLRRLEEARDTLEQALPRHPDNAQLRYELSRVYARLGDHERAAEQTRLLQQLRQKQPADSP